MNFAHPLYLLVGMLACGALLLVWRRHDARQRVALETLLAPHLREQLTASVSMARRVGQRVMFGAAVALVFIALAAPQGGFRWEQTTRRGNDIMFAVDTSRSMLTPDVKPSRLARAKLAIDDFVSHLDGDAVGLVAFAGTAFLQTPMTLDYGAFHESLNALDTHIIPVGGTNISSAIRETEAALHDRPGSDKVLILVTDGEDLQGEALATSFTEINIIFKRPPGVLFSKASDEQLRVELQALGRQRPLRSKMASRSSRWEWVRPMAISYRCRRSRVAAF